MVVLVIERNIQSKCPVHHNISPQLPSIYKLPGIWFKVCTLRDKKQWEETDKILAKWFLTQIYLLDNIHCFEIKYINVLIYLQLCLVCIAEQFPVTCICAVPDLATEANGPGSLIGGNISCNRPFFAGYIASLIKDDCCISRGQKCTAK